jgi:hypothetical protein
VTRQPRAGLESVGAPVEIVVAELLRVLFCQLMGSPETTARGQLNPHRPGSSRGFLTFLEKRRRLAGSDTSSAADSTASADPAWVARRRSSMFARRSSMWS